LDLEMLQTRAAVIKKVRSFFEERNYLELDTPLLSENLIPESCLEVFRTERLFPRGSKKESRPLWLIPSPEIHMKKTIARHRVNVFQICKCFRNGESEGQQHSCEFTMLEYYTMNADYMDSLALTELLFGFIGEEFTRRRGGAEGAERRERGEKREKREGTERTEKREKNFKRRFECVTVAEAFENWAGFDLFAAVEKEGALEEEARRLGLDPMPNLTVGELYDLIFIHTVEPNLKAEKPVALLDYPAFVPCLAKKARNGKTVERWELYWKGIELANCFSEETDGQKVKGFFLNEEAARERACLEKHRIDHDYWKIFENFPRCSGVAMGLDRLIMALCGVSDIDGVLIK
jgi:lysyl-tRNA synthetase class 2